MAARPFGRGAGVRAGLLALALGLPGTGGAFAQERPDSLAPDSLALPDTVPTGQEADTTQADTVFYNLPALDPDSSVGWAAGVWTWDHDAIMASGASTLAELVAEVPGVVTLLAGDYGTPAAVTAFGVGGGGVRILRDGFELFPVDGGVTDLARVGLAGIGAVRLRRGLVGLIVELTSLTHHDARPYSLLEAGTGDLDTNLLRGAFANPTALGGSVAVGIERTDSRGARADEPGNRTGTWLRYQLHRGNDAGLALDFRRMATETTAEPYAASIRRTDWTLRGRTKVGGTGVVEAYWGRSIHRVEDERTLYEREGGTRSQTGVRTTWAWRDLSASGAYRSFGEELPGSRLDLALGGSRPTLGGFSVDVHRASWSGTSTTARGIRVWTRPVAGLSLFGSRESGTYGARTGPLRDVVPVGPADSTDVEEPDTLVADTATVEPEPSFRVTDRTATRVGAQFRWREAVISGARLSLEADSLLPLGLEPDRGQPPLAGGTRKGWEIWGRVPTPLRGLRVEGSLQQWDEGWPYLPKRIYQGAFVYHRTFLESGNFEFWWSIGVRGHDPMTVHQVLPEDEAENGEGPSPTLASVPFAQSWYGRLQLRIVSVRLFVGWENFTVRRNLQDYPDRLLPITRAVYGLRWTMWN